MYVLKELSRTETTITAEMIPMKERRYVENGVLIIEYYTADSNSK